MAASLRDLREALAAALGAIDELQVLAYPITSPTPPTAWVLFDSKDYHQTFADGGELLNFRVQGFLALTNDLGTQEAADEFLDEDGPRSIKAALEADKTLGGLCDDLVVDRVEGRIWRGSDQSYEGAEWMLRVLT